MCLSLQVSVGHLADAHLIVQTIYAPAAIADGKAGIIQVRRAVARGPPQVHRLTVQLGKLRGAENHLAVGVRRYPHRLGKGQWPYPSAQCGRYRGVAVVVHPYRRGHRGQRIG